MGPKPCLKYHKVVLEEKKTVSCDSCRNIMHLNGNYLALLFSEEKPTTVQKRITVFFCSKCREGSKSSLNLLKQITNVKNQITEQKQDVEAVKKKVNERWI